ncbi:hypothetical protein EHS25_007241 [Saitozyma podzolica]|uniref:Amidase domain-containing protein n=1 Tax=Saitozyma podzolica TaxID=1890683 RepID=A0A427XMQ1_9TREE|nr:hypothetical protein EHS25_007241 [Saitozyma podzolica]
MIFPSIHFFTLTAALTSHLALGAALIPRSVPGSKHDTQTPFPGVPMPSSLPAGLDLLQTSIRQLGSFLNNGSVTSVQLVQAQHRGDNLHGLNLRAVLQVAPPHDLLRIAQILDDERRAGTVRSEMHGIPILVKDNIATARELGMHTTGGSLALEHAVAEQDAFVVKRLRDAGAIVLAKSSLSELAGVKGVLRAFSPSETGTTNGWSALGGQTSSGYVFGGFENGGDPMGSSSGSAVGVSVGWAAGALGTDTAGSTVGPASRAALYAIRPTLGLLSRSGVMPVSLEHETVGPMGFTAYDVALMLELMMGREDRDEKTSRIPPQYPPSLTPYAAPLHATFHSLSLGFVRGAFYDSPDPTFLIPGSCPETVQASMIHAIIALRALGANVSDVEMPLDHRGLREVREASVMAWVNEFREDWEGFLPSLTNRSVNSLEELINFNDRHAAAEMPPGECCQDLLVSALAAGGRDSPQHAKATETLHHLAGERGLDHLFRAELGLDALVFSVELGQPLTLTGAMGYPAVTVPLGYCANGLPYGLMFVARKWHEPTLISMMAAWEASWEQRRVPEPLLESNRPQ